MFFEDNRPFWRKYYISGKSTLSLFLNTQFQDLIDSFSKYDSEVSVTQSATPSYYGTFNRNLFYFESQNIRLPDQVETYIPHLVINRIFPWRRRIAISTVITTVVRITKYPQPQSRQINPYFFNFPRGNIVPNFPFHGIMKDVIIIYVFH